MLCATDPGGAGDAALFARAQAGCGDSLNRLMATHDGLALFIVRRQCRGTVSFSDVLQAGRIGLWHAIMAYDPHRGFAFSTYAFPCIVHAVWNAIRQAQRDARRSDRERDAIALMTDRGPVCDPSAAAEATAVSSAVADLVARLPPRLHDVVVLHAGLDDHPPTSFRHIGAARGLSRQRIHHLYGEALIWLRQPAHSQRLRSLLDRHRLADYERATAQADAWRRQRRRRNEHAA